MKRDISMHLVVLASLAGALCAGPAPAQPPPSPHPAPAPLVEAWCALHLTAGTGSGQLASAYEPQVASAADVTGRVSQVLTLDPGAGRGIEFGLNLFRAPSVGLQAFVSRGARDLTGLNTPYQIDLRYVSRPPPAYQPTPVEVRRSVEWPDTVGRVRQWTMGVGPAVRWRHAPATFVASAGLALSRVTGEAEPLGFTRFWLGGHSVLFSEDVRLRAVLGPSTRAGGYLGASLGIDLARHAALAASLRVLLAAEADVPARIDAIIDTTGGTVSRDPGDLARSMSPGPARLAPGRLAVAIGITVR